MYVNPYFKEQIKLMIDNKKVHKTYLEAQFLNSEGNI